MTHPTFGVSALRREVADYLGITLGSLILAIGLVFFLVPHRIAAGGVSGLATVVYYLANLPVGLTMLLLNIPLFIFGFRQLGLRFGVRTLYGTIILSVLIDALNQVWRLEMTSDPLLASIYGGVITGAGLGVVFRSRGTTGGTDLAALLVHRFLGGSVGTALVGIDGAVILLAGLVFGAEQALYAFITVFIAGRVVDLVQEGIGYARAALIISEHSAAIGQEVLTNLNRGATSLEGVGQFSGDRRQLLLVVVTRAEVSKLKDLVYRLDSSAFVIVSGVNEVLGEGFRQLRNDQF